MRHGARQHRPSDVPEHAVGRLRRWYVHPRLRCDRRHLADADVQAFGRVELHNRQLHGYAQPIVCCSWASLGEGC